MAMQTTSVSSYDKDAWDLLTRFALRPQLFFDRLATVKATRQAHQGATVKFTFTDDLPSNTTALTEDADVTPRTFGDSAITVTLVEYGDAVKTTAKLRGTSFIPVDPVVANIVGRQAGLSQDTLTRDTLLAGTNVIYSGDATDRGGVGTGLTATDTLAAADIREITADLRNASVEEVKAGLFAGFVNPDVSVDLRTETGAAAWREPHNYQKAENIWRGEIGAFEGVVFVETPRLEALADAGDGSVDAYQSLIIGKEALAKAYSKTVSGEVPSVRPTPVTDALWRFVGMGWYWLGGYAIMRQAAVRRIESASSLGAN